MLQKTPKRLSAEPSIAILGAGFSGMGMAVALAQRGYENFTIYEKADDVGGTWRENTYPGIACDVPSHLYSFSFDPNPAWSKRYSPGGEIWDYMRGCAREHGLYEHTKFGKRATRIAHDGEEWTIAFDDGSSVKADIVVSGLGGLHEPNIPDFTGMEAFKGPVFHTARWRHDVDLAGKNVAIVGAAASAIQVIPQIAPKVAHLDVYQRTPNWIAPRMDHAYPGWMKGLFRAVPFLARAYRGWIFSMMEMRHLAFHSEDNFMKRMVSRQFERSMEAMVKDPELRAKLTPGYPIGCKRILISDDYFPAIQRENVSVVTDGIDRIEQGGVRTKDGALREADVIILATGFKPFNLLESVEVTGPGGRSLKDEWAGGIKAHKTVDVPGFPNFFMLLGPNSGLGHNSVVLMIEAQVKYVLQLVEAMIAKGASQVEPTPQAAALYDEDLQKRLADRVWAAGCGAWYVDQQSGRNYTLYPDNVRAYLKEMKAPDLGDYVFETARAAA